jgi:diguanylate cyclase (GGDEF)-like protein
MNNANSNLFHNSAEKDLSILIAEDDLTSRTILIGILKKWGYDTIAVKDGQSAWEVLQRSDSPSLAILDWMMPEMDGLVVIRRVRAQCIERPPYIILLTSRDEKSDIFSGLEGGANDYIKKPFEQEELYARIRVGLRTLELQASLYTEKQINKHLATHDPLTEILNRRAILDLLSKELARARRANSGDHGKKVGVGFFDIDHFKRINDQHGHQAGDEVLCGVSEIIGSQLRSYDSLGRFGGDEFMVLAPDCGEQDCQPLFERLTTAVAATPIPTYAGEISITISLGVVLAESDINEEQLLHNVDTAMYQAKRAGGNRTVFAGEGGADGDSK